MSTLSAPHFRNEAVAIARAEAIVWPKGPYCPRCGGFDPITPVRGGRPHRLKRYLAESDFRYNNRATLGIDDTARADRLISGIVGKRLTCRDSSVPGAAGE